MGIYTDYGRFQKAREFKNYCTSGAGIWFAFSVGSPRWDNLISKTSDGVNPLNPPRTIPNVPSSAPAAYTPVYKWFATYKDNNWDGSEELLQTQEYSLLDRSFCDSDPAYTNQGVFPTNNELYVGRNTIPSDDYTPSVLTLNTSTLNGSSNIDSHLWDSTTQDLDYYPSPFIPAFPVGYKKDWDTIVNNIISTDSSYANLGSFSFTSEPTDPTKYESWSNAYHLAKGVQNSSTAYGETPIGLMSFIQGTARFVEPLPQEDADNLDATSSVSAFKYGSHYWRIVSDSEVNKDRLPHHILLTVSVFPNELAESSLVERMLPVRQVSVFKFPDCISDQIPELEQQPTSRLYRVLRRDKFQIIRSSVDLSTLTIDTSGSWDSRKIYLPFNCADPMDPNQTSGTGVRGSIEMLINDFMTARRRDVQQTDRYGYIIGF